MDNEKKKALKVVLEKFLSIKMNVWTSVKKNSLSLLLKEQGFHKRYYLVTIQELLKHNVIEKRGTTSATEYRIIRMPENFNEIIENILNGYSAVRNKEYVFGRDRLELGKKYYMVFVKSIYEVQVVGKKINRNFELVYEMKKKSNSKNGFTILKNIKASEVYSTITSAGDVVKNKAVKDCRFLKKNKQSK